MTAHTRNHPLPAIDTRERLFGDSKGLLLTHVLLVCLPPVDARQIQQVYRRDGVQRFLVRTYVWMDVGHAASP